MIINYFSQAESNYVLRRSIPLEYRPGLDIYIGQFHALIGDELMYLKEDVQDYCEDKGLEAKFERVRLEDG